MLYEELLARVWHVDHWLYTCPNPAYTPAYAYGRFRQLWAIGARQVFMVPSADNRLWQQLQQLPASWWFGVIGYDVKNAVEALYSQKPSSLQLPDVYLFEPEWVFEQTADQLLCLHGNEDAFWRLPAVSMPKESIRNRVFELHAAICQEQYISVAQTIQEDIRQGEVYELNYCIEYQAEATLELPWIVFESLNNLSPMPFAAYARLNNYHVLCASPERYLKREHGRIVSQPMKGTAPRGRSIKEDAWFRKQLKNSDKERAENMMIVDLVRNDLAKIAQPGTVQVDEIFGIYTFRHVHQMVSTISAVLSPSVHWSDCLKATFPMGSMTGAPKIRAMQLIEDYEQQRRAWFSGALGYITPEGDFDWNVLIRTIFYNHRLQRLCFQVGSAITYDALPEQEWKECQLKAKTMKQVLHGLHMPQSC